MRSEMPPQCFSATVPKENLKVFSHAFQALSKVGAEIFFDATVGDRLQVYSLSDTRTAILSFTFRRSFFSRFSFPKRSKRALLRCRAPVKGCAQVFRNLRSVRSLRVLLPATGGGNNGKDDDEDGEEEEEEEEEDDGDVEGKENRRRRKGKGKDKGKGKKRKRNENGLGASSATDAIAATAAVAAAAAEVSSLLLIFELECEYGVHKTHSTHCQPCEVFHAPFDPAEAVGMLRSRPSLFTQLLGHIHGADEVSLIACRKSKVDAAAAAAAATVSSSSSSSSSGSGGGVGGRGAEFDCVEVRSYYHCLDEVAARSALQTEVCLFSLSLFLSFSLSLFLSFSFSLFLFFSLSLLSSCACARAFFALSHHHHHHHHHLHHHLHLYLLLLLLVAVKCTIPCREFDAYRLGERDPRPSDVGNSGQRYVTISLLSVSSLCLSPSLSLLSLFSPTLLLCACARTHTRTHTHTHTLSHLSSLVEQRPSKRHGRGQRRRGRAW